ncbi:uncharacterized protein GVI51_C02277 [Nakaseomyces glabratus]|uniref:Sm protein B n=1 Tax=Candida glabrata (strain ATCC 2001 / BCRC 20586 / JCM 3761 / NBRC 0622 / NRRL Y-65 / CBS 138) TaxID=284593 RepID=Q6FWV9_CANGA|nr:uncharacterized protein CAGL0C02497g [Nakaseomyces glabratus]KAH7608623.1 LSM domain [Nakaseomyces glabratus]KAH7609498.1 LSM domain [Nakaseomyces glabratus]QHS64915.1 uncharacterized protein GVI51_C02277 [Nakaseomyces glabratus]CAG58191.1 unnamed protein product [Nakaseomyces glabratus]|eukprot:XP_445285.1 uncharacterized protein CAGL0C02497g [[Candida] glabrata]
MVGVQVKHNSRLADLINYKLRVITQDGRVYIGILLAFDKHMNVVLSDCVEERVLKKQIDDIKNKGSVDRDNLKVEKRVLGLVILRGEQILSTVVEDKPLLSKAERLVVDSKQQKQLAKERNKRKKNTTTNGGKVAKSNSKDVKPNERTIQQPVRKFQPPPGFKRK